MAKFLAASLALLAAGSFGCQNVAATRQETLADDLPCAHIDGVTGIWQSVPWPDDSGCAWLPFGKRTTLIVPHSLGRRPTVVLTYLSYEERGSPAVLSAGDMSRIEEATVDRIVIVNRTLEEFYLRIVAY